MNPCPFCHAGRIVVCVKKMRRTDWRDARPAAYARCLACNARGPLATADTFDHAQAEAVRMWDSRGSGNDLGPLFHGVQPS